MILVLRTNPAFGDPAMSYLIPPNGRAGGNEILPTDKICKTSQQDQKQTDGSPRLKAAAGSFVALRYQENGHVSLPETQLGKPENRGNVYIYGTTEPKPDDTLLSIHNVWNSDGSGGDKRGVLLATQPYDDGQCYQVNGGQISGKRQTEFKHATSQLMGADLWCQNDIKLPSDAPSGKPYTLYWVWDWPTAPGPDLPKGKAEVYTTCMDVDITAANQQKSVGNAKYMDGQPIDNAAIKSYMNDAGAGPSAAAPQSSQQASPAAASSPSSVAPSQPTQAASTQVAPTQQPYGAASGSYPSMSAASSIAPAVVPQATNTAVAVSENAGGQPQLPPPTPSQGSSASSQPAPPAVSAQPLAPAAGGITTVYITKTVTPSAAIAAASSAPTYVGRRSAKFRMI